MIEADDEVAHERDQRHFGGLAALDQALVHKLELRMMPAGHQGAHIQDAADARSAAAREVIETLQQFGVPRQFRATRTLTRFGRRSAAPPNQGECRLIDGTLIRVAGREKVAGDPIHTRLDLKGHAVTVDAIGIVAVRLAADGTVEAMAAGGVTHFEGPGLAFDPPQRVDLALWRAADGRWRGAIQGQRGSIPPALSRITGNWLRLALPQLLQGSDSE